MVKFMFTPLQLSVTAKVKETVYNMLVRSV